MNRQASPGGRPRSGDGNGAERAPFSDEDSAGGPVGRSGGGDGGDQDHRRTVGGAEERVAQRALEAVQSDLRAARERIGALARENARLRTQMQRLERVAGRMRQMALHDDLTGLPNRGLLLDRLRQAIAQAERNGGHVAVLMLDLDRFKDVNDRFGHAAGDWLLQQVAARLDAAVRAGDTASRLGGDEFVVMLPRVAEPATVLTVIAKLRATLGRPYAMADEQLHIRPSLGAAIYPDDGRSPAELLEHADAAMYREKARRSLPADWPGGGAGLGEGLRVSGAGQPPAGAAPSADREGNMAWPDAASSAGSARPAAPDESSGPADPADATDRGPYGRG